MKKIENKIKAKPGIYRVKDEFFVWNNPKSYEQWRGQGDYNKLGRYIKQDENIFILPVKLPPCDFIKGENGYVWVMSIDGLGVAYVVNRLRHFLEPVKVWRE